MAWDGHELVFVFIRLSFGSNQSLLSLVSHSVSPIEARRLPLKVCSPSEGLLGNVHHQTVVCCASHINTSSSAQEDIAEMRMTFGMFDESGDGALDEDELEQVLRVFVDEPEKDKARSLQTECLDCALLYLSRCRYSSENNRTYSSGTRSQIVAEVSPGCATQGEGCHSNHCRVK